MLLAVEFYLEGAKEIVIVAPAQAGDLEAMLAPLRTRFVPNRTLSVVRAGEVSDADAKILPLTRGRKAIGGLVTAYVCENRVCAYPTTSPEEFLKQIRAKKLSAP
jgi:uncharacterized protein YyaL (SSP411 family)